MRENGAHMTRSVHLRALQLSYYTFQVKNVRRWITRAKC